MYNKQLYIFEPNHAIFSSISNSLYPQNFEDFFILPNVLYICKCLNHQRKKISLTMSAGGVSHGILSEQNAWEIALEANSLLDGMFCDIKIDCYHKNGQYASYYDKCQKDVACKQIILEQKGTLQDVAMVSNLFSDYNLAKQIGVDFIWGYDFFRWDKKDLARDMLSVSLKKDALHLYRINALRGKRISPTTFKKGI